MKILFEVHSILCRIIRATKNYWKYIFEIKHPESFKKMGFEKSIRLVKDTLKDPDIIIRERIDPNVYIYYKCNKKFYLLYMCSREALKQQRIYNHSIHNGSFKER